MTGAEPRLDRGWISQEIAAEFPELALVYTTIEGPRSGRSPDDVRARLRHASDRFTGAKAIVMRQQPIPWAYRVFFRHIGIDPDERRTPIEAIAVERLRAGGFQSQGIVGDALLLATLETGVPVEAFDADAIDGEIGVRLARAGETLGDGGWPIAARRLVIADSQGVLAVLFGERSAGQAPRAQSARLLLAGIQVKGVPQISVAEALWTAGEILSGSA